MSEKNKYGMNREPGLQNAPTPLKPISFEEADKSPKVKKDKWECDDGLCEWMFLGPAYLAYAEYGRHNNEVHSESSRRINKVE